MTIKGALNAYESICQGRADVSILHDSIYGRRLLCLLVKLNTPRPPLALMIPAFQDAPLSVMTVALYMTLSPHVGIFHRVGMF